ncbi:MAG TPA: CBS domain-containing protein [Longimicrobiales bacterium]|nr:CBS domain-containing protein [Longimicrobiales bacterium]
MSEAMTRDGLFTVSPDDDDDTVMARMKEGQVRRVPVVQDDRVVGIIAQADLALDIPDSKAREVERTVERISEPARPER